jgi:serine acetyltransferase
VILFKLLVALLPFWPLKRLILIRFFRYHIHPQASIGYSFIFPMTLHMDKNARIGHASVCKGISILWMGRDSSIGRLNWITGFPRNNNGRHFADQPRRRPRLILGTNAAITNRHLIDCTDSVIIGPFSTVAGFSSQVLTHSVDISLARQVAKPVLIGKYSFVGTGSIMLPGCRIPSYSVVAAGSVVNKPLRDSYYLYGGIPARPIRILNRDDKYFAREQGFII